MDPKTFDNFLANVAQQQHSPADMASFLAWLQTLPEAEAAAALDRYEQVFKGSATIDAAALSRIAAGIESKLDSQAAVYTIPRKRTPVVFYLRAAAVFIVVAGLAFFFYKTQSKQSREVVAQATAPIVPGKNQAVLKLGDGKSILLEEVADGVIKMNDTVTGFEKKSGLLVAKNNASATSEANEMNMLETPRGGQYQIALPDGTRVWLNASTRLYFPTAFNPGERRVKLSGEAYFEVKSDPSHPFIVETGTGAALRVLGTSFNVNAYQDEAHETTTLLTGSLQVTRNQSQALLKPGQQATVNAATIMEVQEVETSYAVAWKDGNFMFNREPIKNVMNKIARWYDVDIVYQGPVPETRFWGTVSRFSKVGDVLELLQATGRVHFTIEGRRIYVRK